MMDGSDRDMSGKTNEGDFEITLGNVSRILNNVGIGELQMTESDKETSEGPLPASHVNARRVEKGGSTFFDRGKVVINDKDADRKDD